MMTRRMLEQVWGEKNLRRASMSALEPIEISQASKAFLVEIGLPKYSDLPLVEVDFTRHKIPTLEEYGLAKGYKVAVRAKHLWRLGHCGPDLCLDTAQDGAVVTCDLTDTVSDWFVNRNIELFAESLTTFRKDFILADRGTTDADYFDLLSRVESLLRSMDSKAFSSDTSFWPGVFKMIRRDDF